MLDGKGEIPSAVSTEAGTAAARAEVAAARVRIENFILIELNKIIK